jgi:hypothetical protein
LGRYFSAFHVCTVLLAAKGIATNLLSWRLLLSLVQSTIELTGESQTGVKTMRCGGAAAGHPEQMDPANKQ